jgi:glutamate synthase (NADPH/NADH) small chain
MTNPRGFIEIKRKEPGYRPVEERIKDFQEVETSLSREELEQQADRCMDCGIPFCHGCGCPLSNYIPEWNELVAEGKWEEAFYILNTTNNFPEFTGRICPALCEASCTAGLGGDPVTIRQIEKQLAEEAFAKGYIKPLPPAERSGYSVAVIGGGPAGLALADSLNKRGHCVTVFEKNKFAGGLMRYGIPDFKLDKNIIERRLNLMKEEGVVFKTGVCVGKDIFMDYICKEFDAVAITVGAEQPRDLPVPGRELNGIYFAMEFLAQQNRRVSGAPLNAEPISAKGKKVLVIGGGDTGSDCVGTSIRQGAVSVTQIEIMPKPPESRSEFTPWPEWPYQLRTSSSHKEGCERKWNIMTKAFTGEDGNVKKVQAVEVVWDIDGETGRPIKPNEVPDSAFEIEADLVLLAMGFTGPAAGMPEGPISKLDLELDARGNVKVDENGMSSVDGVFAAGDAATGASLVVRAINSGRLLAESIDTYLNNK